MNQRGLPVVVAVFLLFVTPATDEKDSDLF